MQDRLYSLLIILPFIFSIFMAIMSKVELKAPALSLISIASSSAIMIVCSIAYFYCKEDFFIFKSSSYISLTLKANKYSIYFIMLTCFISLMAVLESDLSIKRHRESYLSLLFCLQGILTLFFLAEGIVAFFILFEASLLPMLFIIGVWGGKERIKAAFYFFIYTFIFSIPALVCVLYLNRGGGIEISKLHQVISSLSTESSKTVWLIMMIGFAVKIPMFPLHSWLPKAHVQAPTGGSMLLAGVLLKIGSYAMLRILVEQFGEISSHNSKAILIISLFSIIYGSISALGQKNIKSLVAYSSIAHMGYITAGLFSNSEQGVSGAVFHMMSHGLISSALFAMVGMLYRRSGTMYIGSFYSSKMPIFSTFFVFLSFAAMSIPGTSGFVGELFIILGVLHSNPGVSAAMALCMVLGAMYMLKLIRSVVWGKGDAAVADLNFREIAIVATITVPIVALGFCSNVLMNKF